MLRLTTNSGINRSKRKLCRLTVISSYKGKLGAIARVGDQLPVDYQLSNTGYSLAEIMQ
jgi:hypothetical protein